jgi:hypothetical protein
MLVIMTSVSLLMALFTTGAIAAHNAGAPSGDGVQPVALHGNFNCDLTTADGDPADAQFELRIQSPADGTFPVGATTGFRITLDVHTDPIQGQTFDWTATGGVVTVVYVKAGPDTNRYDYGAGDTMDTALHGTINQDPRFFGLSHLSFCYNVVATPSIATQVSNASITLGGSVTDTATLSGGNNPTGTVTFRAYSDANCAVLVFTSADRPLSGSPPSATSAAFTPTAAGTYRWIATYNGDLNNASVSGLCGATGETVVVSRPASDTNTTPSSTVSTTWTATLNDSATVTGNNPTGNVTFNLYKGTCAALGTAVLTQIVALNATGNASTSPGLTVGSASTHGAGTYNWIVSYEGDANNAPSASACGEETQVVTAATNATVTTPAP